MQLYGGLYMISRRATLKGVLLSATMIAGATGFGEQARAADKVLKIGIDLSFTGADAENAGRIANGAILAFDEANAKHEVPGYTFQLVKYDDATPTAGQYDPAQAATNARSMVSDKSTVAAIGPQMSGAGKAMAPILSQGDLAIITPSSTNPDITDPKFAAQYRPAGKAIYFRTVATDAFQGPNMANYMADKLKVKSVFVLDDTGAYGVGLADAFQAQAEKKGLKILGRDKLDPKAVDYSSILTKIKSLNPDSLYYGGVAQAGVKLAKQAYDIIPKMIRAGGDGIQSADFLKGAGFPAVEGWYATVASPHFEASSDAKAKAFSDAYSKKFNQHPDDYTVTCYTAAEVIIQAVKDLVKAKKPVDRNSVRDAIQDVDLKNTLVGPVEFDANGDLKNKVISVFQITKDDKAPLDDPTAQYKYVGTAPMA
ncbi:MAG: branched-chain amino acid ABC transporter substrate-binding protein [Acetobacteraceae bacterium]|nr:branched-chain amino acid ABC transporter substrate-binding protein [Acetobacteraceae bacterium]